MSTRILTLFGEEIVPEPQKPAAKGRAKKGDKAASAEEPAEDKEANAQQEQQATAAVVAPTIEVVFTEESVEAIEPAPPETVIAETEIRVAAPVPEETKTIITEVKTAAADETEETSTAPPLANPPAKKSRKRAGEDGLLAKPQDEIISEDWSGDKKYYTIGEVSGFFKVATSHIRFWTNEFKLKVRTTRKGDRLYTPEQVKELRAIYHLVKERGFTLSGAKTKLKEQNKRDVTTVDLKTSLQDLRARLVILRDQLT
ncbi:MAG: MerR family transcriptional regulator [Taibaiella sp.]|nr:MerR family transcriptional regulator [Taibaiella sp.]